MENKGYTQDGSVDLRGRPAVASRTGRWKACGFLVVYEAFERMAFYGVAANLVVYLTTQLHEETVSSVRNVNNWSGSVWMTPIIGAYIADTYLGRFWTFTISSVIYVLGMVLLTAAVRFKPFHPKCNPGNGNPCPTSTSEIAFFYASLYIMAIGAGGTKPNISTFGADQFDDYDAYERKLKASFFNWWMFSSFVGGLMATLGLVYVQENVGWGLGYGIPTAGLMLSLLLFYSGTPFYRHKVKKPESPVKEIFGVLKKAFENRRYKISDLSMLYELEPQQYSNTSKRQLHYSSSFKFLDKAAHKESTTPCTVTQVEATKLFCAMFLVWLTTIVPTTIFAQVNTFFVKQGTTLNRSLGHNFHVPPASLGSFIVISMLISVPIYDKLFVPFMRRRTGKPRGITLFQRLGAGYSSMVVVMTVAYFVERKRMSVIKRFGIEGTKEMVPMSIFWLLPQYLLLGIGEVFISIGMLEFFYEQSPEGMQSLGTTFFTSGVGVGNFMNSLLVTTVDTITRSGGGGKSWIGDNLNDSRLDYYYVFLIVLLVVNFAAFVWIARWYKYKNEVVEGVVEKRGLQMDSKVTDANENDEYLHLGEKL